MLVLRQVLTYVTLTSDLKVTHRQRSNCVVSLRKTLYPLLGTGSTQTDRKLFKVSKVIRSYEQFVVIYTP